MVTSPAVAALRRFLDEAGTGRIVDLGGLIDHLRAAWDQVNDVDASMTAVKLSRIEDPEWSPPTLTFIVERHGGTQFGSTRATLQQWTIDLDAVAVSVDERRFRQLRPQAARIDVRSIADEIAGLIVEGADDDRLEWSSDRRQVHVLIGVVIPATYRQTTTARRRRFRDALDERLDTEGWTPRPSAWRYARRG